MVDEEPEQDRPEGPHQQDDRRHGDQQRARLAENPLGRGVRERVDQAADEIGDQRLEDREHEAEREERDEEALRLGDEVPVEPPQRIRRRLLGRLFPEIDPGLEKAEHRLELIVVAPNQTGEGRNDATLFGRAVTNALQID